MQNSTTMIPAKPSSYAVVRGAGRARGTHGGTRRAERTHVSSANQDSRRNPGSKAYLRPHPSGSIMCMARCHTLSRDLIRKNKSTHSENDPMGMAAGAWDFYFSQGVPLGALQMACASNGMYLGLIQGDTEKLFDVYLADFTILYLLYLIVGAQGAHTDSVHFSYSSTV